MIISGVICRKWFGTGNRCNFVDELRVKRRAAFPLPKCCPYILTLWIREKTEPTAGKRNISSMFSIRRIYCSYICFAISWESADIQQFKMWNA